MIPRVLLALSDQRLRHKVRQALADCDVLETSVYESRELSRQLQYGVNDLIVIGTPLLSKTVKEKLAEIRHYNDAPAIALMVAERGSGWAVKQQNLGAEILLAATTPVASCRKALVEILKKRQRQAKMPLDLGRRFSKPRLSDFASRSPLMQVFVEKVKQVIKCDASILLQGETGVGKERLARAIHNESLRAKGPFVAVNCGALPESLMESELFGHEKGSFTGATRKHRGFFELAHKGTVFLDEISDLPYHSQVKLLRVLQEREIHRVGSERVLKFDVRVIVDTNRELWGEVRSGNFRRDLFYRLNVIALTIPPLCERREDIPDLAYSYINFYRAKINKVVNGITPDALDALVKYNWPGNVRELINVIERAVLFCPTDQITLGELPAEIFRPAESATLPSSLSETSDGIGTVSPTLLAQPIRQARKTVVEQFERDYLTELLKATSGRINETARRAGIQPRALFEKMRQLGLKKEDFRSPSQPERILPPPTPTGMH